MSQEKNLRKLRSKPKEAKNLSQCTLDVWFSSETGDRNAR